GRVRAVPHFAVHCSGVDRAPDLRGVVAQSAGPRVVVVPTSVRRIVVVPTVGLKIVVAPTGARKTVAVQSVGATVVAPSAVRIGGLTDGLAGCVTVSL
ncbi:MAG: hypothetical protein AAFR70_04940, partial [Pseudomonadota bacterium]